MANRNFIWFEIPKVGFAFLHENLEKSFEWAENWFGAAVRWDGLPAKFSDGSREAFVNYCEFSATLCWGCVELSDPGLPRASFLESFAA